MSSTRYRTLTKIDPILLVLPLLISFLGLLFIYSASHEKAMSTGVNFTLKQFNWMLFGAIVMIVATVIDYRSLVNYSYLIYGCSVVLLILVLSWGHVSMGAQRRIFIAGLWVQPSEVAKITTALALTYYLTNARYRITLLSSHIIPFVITFVSIGLIMLQPDLGTAAVFIPMVFTMLYVCGARIKHLILVITAGLAASPIAWHLMHEYQRRRLTVFLDPSLDPTGAGYTITQSRIAIGSGHLFGKGWMSGPQNRLNFLPERYTDFVFSVVGEEWGFVGSTCLIALYLILIIRMLQTAGQARNLSGRMLACGVAAIIMFQVFVNVGMASGILPVTGLPLPFITYGGASMLTMFAAVGLVQSIRIHDPAF